MTEKDPLVSVIMPAFNAERYIRDSILSVVNQQYDNWELLIINDGSTDNTRTIINEFNDHRIYYFEKANGGVSSARNVGLANMRGKFFCFLDADDQLPPQSLHSRTNYLKSHPEVDLLDGFVEVMDETMRGIHKIYKPSFKGKVAKLYIRLSDKVFFGPNLMIRNRKKKYNFKEGMTHVEDLWFYTEMAWMEDLSYAYVPEVVYRYRKAPGSAMSNLIGIEKGYWHYYNNVKSLSGVRKDQLDYLSRRILRIMFLSYLKRLSFRNAIKSLFHFFQKM